jgi:hypothetical protein
MNAQQRRLLGGTFLILGGFWAAANVTHAQAPAQGPTRTSGADAAEREKIWNSPNMLRARAWLQDYCSKSAKVTPEMAKKYQSELEHMSAAQLQLWLLKFDHEEEQRQQQHAFWQQAHSQNLSRAMAATQAARQSYATINQEQSEAAGVAQQQINEQQEFTQSEQLNKQLESVGPYPYGYLNPGYGGIHFHYHLHPYAY